MSWCRFVQLARVCSNYASKEARERWRLASWPAYWVWWSSISKEGYQTYEQWWKSNFKEPGQDKVKDVPKSGSSFAEMRARAARNTALLHRPSGDLLGSGDVVDDEPKSNIQQLQKPKPEFRQQPSRGVPHGLSIHDLTKRGRVI